MKRAIKLLGKLSFLLLFLSTVSAQAYEGRFLAHEDIILYGMGLKVEPARQVVPKNIATIVSTYMQVPTLPTAEIPPLAADALVKGTLRGPGLDTPLELSARANSPFNIPPLTVPGMYSLDNIRLESGGQILFRGTPESVSIEIIEKLLVSQITARPLTAQEIKDKGIVFDKTNFQAYNFTAAFAIGTGDPIKINMPVLLPNLAGATDVNVSQAGLGASLPEPQLKDVRTIIPDALKLAQTKIPNLSVKTFSLKALDYKGNTFDLPPIPGVIVIPGDIGFLNQYFSVMLMVGNVAPEYSNLVVKDITATILLPAGNDKVVGTSDDPLAMANTTKGPSPMLQAVVQPGLDGKLGTADDIVSLAPGQSGNAEFLVEGRREGSHTIEMEITGTLTGLPIGPVTVRGRAMGTVLVRNPNFTLTFTHPDVVNAGEEYVLDVTVTNTSESPANFVSVNLHQQQISGADLVGEGSQQIETIPPGDSATVSFNLRSKVSGTIFAATLDSDEHVSGRFQLKTSVGELGIPLSPDSLVLPKEAGSLPKTLRDAAIGLLGKAYAVATAPAAALPKDVIRFGKKIVWDRGIEVAQAGFRHTLHEPLPDSAEQLLFDFMGSNFSRLAETNPFPADRSNAESDYSGFDDLRRRSIRGDALADAVANLLKSDMTAKGGSDFQRDLASKIAYRPGHLSVMLDSGSAPLPVSLTLVDSQGRKLGGIGAKGKIVKEIPYSDYLTFKDQTTTPPTTSGQLAIIAVPTAGAFRIRVERLPGADPAATFNLGIVAPDAAGVLQQRSFSGITTAALPTVELNGSPYSFTVETFAEGLPLTGTPQAATISRPIPDIAPSIISVVQQPDADVVKNDCGIWRFGRIVAVLFSEEVTAASVQDKLGRSLITNYTLDGNKVVGVALQPGNRIAFLALRDPIGQFIPRSITFDNISDRRGNLLASQSVPIEATLEDPGAVVSGKVLQPDGTLLSGAEVRLFTLIQEPGFDGCDNVWYGVSSKSTGADAAFGWDYVRKQTNKIVAVNPEDEEFRSVPFSVARNGQRLNVNIVFLGRGTLTGKILGEDGMTPLSGAQLRVTSLTDDSQFAYTTDSTGTYTIPKIPVGNLIIEAVHLGTNSKITQSGYIGTSGSTVELNLVLLTEALRKVTVKYGAISGHVLHYDGATPVSGVPVYGFYQDNSQDGVRCPLVPGPDGPYRPSECAVASGTTTSVGAYGFTEVPAGNYRIYTFDQAASQEGAARITLAADGAVSANILLNGGFGTIKGIVKDADGNPVADAEVGGGLSLTRTDAKGLFTLTDVPLGSRTIVAVSQALLAKGSVTVDISTPGAEYGATIVLESQGGIYGTIHTADGSLAGGIKVNLLQPSDSGMALISSTTSNASGAYQFANVPLSGSDYFVSAFLPDLSDGNIGSTAIRFQGQRVRLDLTFKGKGTVTGSISNAQGTTGLVGKVSVSALRVVAAQSGQDLIGLKFEYTSHLQITDTTFASNRFSFSNIFVGPIVITAAGVFSPDPVTFSGEIKADGDIQNFDMRLTATSVITGTVYGPDGVSVSKNAEITYKSDEFKTICTDDGCTSLPQGIQEEKAVSDENGRFTLPLVNAGKFTLSVVERDINGNPTGRIGKMNGLVRAGQTADVAVRLQARAPVKVTVFTHNSTTPVANAWVTVEEAARIGNTTRKYKTDLNGIVQFSGADQLNEGSFTVLAESNDGFVGRASGKIVTDGTEVAVNVYLFDHTVTVKGVVYRPDGITPVANAEVSISNGSGDLAFAVTNASGEYIQDFIPLGNFRLEVFEAATGRRGFATATAYISTPTVTVNINEMAIGQIQGTLFQSGVLTPLSRWRITLHQNFPSGRSMSLIATTGLDGRFTFPGVPVGEFSISAFADGQNPVSAQGYLTREGEVVDIPMVASLVKPARGTINGWVYHPDGTPAADAAVCLGQCAMTTTADSDGRFSFTDVALGRFSVQAGSQVTRESGMGYGDLPYAGATGYVKVVMAGLGTISGTVIDAGVLYAGAKVVLTKSPDAGCGAAQCTTYSNPTTGAFTFLNVPAGTFTVYAEDPLNAQKNGSAGGLLNPGGSAQVTVAFADTGSLKAKVLFASGTPASGIIAELRSGGFVLYHDSDATGLVSFKGVPKGDYLLTLQDPAGLGIAKKTVQIVNDLDLSNAPIMLDEAPPAVKSSSPLPGEIRVALAAPIVITFSEPVQPGSIDTSSFSLTSATGAVTGSRVISVSDTVVTFTPLQPLKDESLYTIRVSGVKDRVDRPMLQDFVATFTTVDITPPHIVSFGPARGSSGAPLESVIRIMFSEPVNPTAFTGTAITVSDANGTLAGRVDMVFGNTGMVFTPLYPLKENTAYTVTLLPARDLSDNLQAAEPPYTFRSLDRTPPVISSLTTPATVIENAITTVTPVFGNASDIAVVDWYLNGAPAGAVRPAQSATYSFSFQALPSLGIPGGAPIRISAIATDTSGNRALIGTETSITVVTDTPPTATITLPLGGTSVRNNERVVVRVEATDDMGVARIAYQAAGGQFPAADTVAVAPAALSAQKEFAFYVPADAVPGAQIVINATVVDSKGQSGKAAPVTVTVSDATPPAVTFAGLSSGAVVRPGQTITAVVAASDLGGIKQVSFRANSGTTVLRDISPPRNSVAASFSYTVPNSFTSADIVRLEAFATDVAGNSAAAAAVVLPVADTTPPQVTLHTSGNTDFMVPGQSVTIVVDAQDDSAVTGITLVGSGAFTYSNTLGVTPPAGVAQKSFTITVPGSVTEGAVLSLAATAVDAVGNVSAPSSLNLTARILASVQLPTSQLIAAGDSVALSITLDQPAPAAGLQVNLSPATTAIQLQPASLSFAAGETTKSFTLNGMSGGNSSFGVAIQGVTLGRVIVTVRGGVVSGKVVTASQVPVAGAEVVINGVTTTSGANGTFLVEGIGGPAISVKAYDTVNNMQGAASGVMNVGNGFLKNVTVIVSQAGSVIGTVKKADQTPVGEGVQVDLTDPQQISIPLFSAFTLADGSYSFPQVPLGTYTVEAHDTSAHRGRSTAYLTVSGAQVIVPVTFLGTGTVNGVVQNSAGNGVSGLTVTLQSSSMFGSLSRTAISDSVGGYSFADVPVGSFSLSTRDDATNLAASTTGSITTHAQTVTANLNLASWASLEGHVYRFGGTSPAAGVTVKAGGHSSTTDSLGAYRFEVLPLGYYTVSVQDNSTRTNAQVSLRLQTDRENRVQDLILNGSATIAVTVLDNSSNPVPGARVSLNDPFGSLSATGDVTGTLLFERVYPGNYTVSGVSGTLHGSISGTIAVGENAAIFVTIAADPSATISGTVFAPDGQTPAGGVTVNLRTSGCYWYCSSYSMTTAGDGTYQFTTLPLSSYDLTVVGANGQLRAKATAINLTSNGQTDTRNLTMIGLGTVSGRILLANAADGAPNMRVDIRALNPDFGRAYTVWTNAAGFYQVDQVPVGAISVSAGDLSLQLLGDAGGTISGDGVTLTLDVVLKANGVALPQTLYDGNNLDFPIPGNGSISSSVFGTTGAALLTVTPSGGSPVDFAAVISGTQEQLGREIVLRQPDVAGLSVTRKVFVPQNGYFARYLEIFDNLNGTDATVTVGVKSGFYSERDGSYQFWANTTSSGDALLQAGGTTPDYWAVFDNVYNSYYGSYYQSRTAMIWGGPGAATPASLVADIPADNYRKTGLDMAWNLMVPANGRVAIMHFVVQNNSVSGAKASAERLVQLPPEALAGLSQDELLAIRNFAVPVDGSSPVSALPPLTGNVTVTVQDALGAIPSGALVKVELQSASPIFNRTYSANMTSSTGQAIFTSNMNDPAQYTKIALPVAPYTVTASRTFNPNNYGSYPMPVKTSVQGDFAVGSSQSENTLSFTNSGNISGIVRKSTGEPQATGNITFNFGPDLSTTPASDGSYAFKVLQPVLSYVTVSVPSIDGGTPITVQQQVTVIAGQTVTADITLPPLGTVSGQLLTWDGSIPPPRTPVTLTGVTPYRISTLPTDTGGNFTFSMVPPGTYKLSSTDPASGMVTTGAEFTMVAGEALTQNLKYLKSGRVAASLFYADGVTAPSYSYYTQDVSMQVLDAAGTVLSTNPQMYFSNPLNSNLFASNEAQLKVRMTYRYTQPSYGSFTAVGETTISGFSGVSSTPLPVNVTVPVNKGTVIVQLKNSSGAAYSGSAIPIQLQEPGSGVIWGSCSTVLSTGSCVVSNLHVGPAGFAVKVVMNGVTIAETTAIMTGSGQVQTVELTLSYDPVAFPKELFDGNAMPYDIYGDGSLHNGKNGVFYQGYGATTNAMTLSVAPQGSSPFNFTGSANGVAEDQGRELSTTQADLAGLNVNRKVYVPKDGYFARYLDIFTNPTNQPLTVDLGLATNFYSYYDFIMRAASDGSGDTVPTNRDLTGTTWAVVDDVLDNDPFSAYSSMPPVAIIWGGSGAALTPATASFGTKQTYYRANLKSSYQSVVVPVGQSVALMSFLVQQTSVAAAKASAERLAQLPPEALSGLSSQEMAMIANFAIPASGTSTLAPLPPLTGTVNGTLKPYDGQPSTQAGSRTVTLKSDSPYFGRTYSTTADSSGVFTFYGNPLTSFTLVGEISGSAYKVTSPPVSGTFADGQSSVTRDILFTSAGRINALVYRADGTTAVTNAEVKATVVSDCQYCNYTAVFSPAGAGSYQLDFAQPGMHYLSAVIPPPGNSGGTSLTVTASVTAVANMTTPVELRLPPMGSISGTVKDRSGNLVAGNPLRVTSTTNAGFTRYLSTYNGANGGQAGTYSFTDLPADTYTLEVTDTSGNGVVYRYTITLTAGGDVIQLCQYGISGTVTGKVSFRSASADLTYIPKYVGIEVRDPDNIILASTSTSNGNTFTTNLFAGNGRPLTLKATYRYYYGNGFRDITGTTTVADFTSNGENLTANLTLPADRGNVLVKVVDANNVAISSPIVFELHDSNGLAATTTYTQNGGQYTFTDFYSDQTALTARAVYMGRGFDVPFTFVPNGTATATVVIPHTTLSGTVFAGDGVTPITGFTYVLTSEDGTITYPCDSQAYGYYWYSTYITGVGYAYYRELSDITQCSSVNSTWAINQHVNPDPLSAGYNYPVPVLRKVPIQNGDRLKLQVSPGSGFGLLSYSFTYTGNSTVDATLPIFVAKGSVTYSDGSAYVNGASVSMVVTDTAVPPGIHTYTAWTDPAGNFTLMGASTGSYSLTTQTSDALLSGAMAGCGSATPDPCTISGFNQPIAGLNISLESTGSVSGTLTQGGSPISGMTVVLTYTTRSLNLTATTDAAGLFTFSQIPQGAFTVKAELLDGSGGLVSSSNVVSGTLDAQHPTISAVALVLTQQPGTISGIINAPDGLLKDYCNSPITLTRVSDSSTFRTNSDCAGRYGFANLPADGYLLTFSDYIGGEGPYYSGSAYGQIAAGGMLSLDVSIQRAVSLMYGNTSDVQPSAALFRYAVSAGGELKSGGSVDGTLASPFFMNNNTAGSYLSVSGGFLPDGQFALQPWIESPNILQSRKLLLPSDGSYLRYFDTIQNLSAAPVTFTQSLYGTMGYLGTGGSWGFVNTPASTGGTYTVVQPHGVTGYPVVGSVIGGSGATAATIDYSLVTADSLHWSWSNLAVPADGKVCLLHYIFQSNPADTAAATARAEALRNLTEPGALDLLTAEERTCIVNFVVPAP